MNTNQYKIHFALCNCAHKESRSLYNYLFLEHEYKYVSFGLSFALHLCCREMVFTFVNSIFVFTNRYLRPPKGERSDTPAAHVASVRGEGVTDYMTTDGNARL